jgi:hypothetical protein
MKFFVKGIFAREETIHSHSSPYPGKIQKWRDALLVNAAAVGALDKARNHLVYQFIPARVIQPRCSSECDLNHSLSRPLAASKRFTRFTSGIFLRHV